MFYVFARLSHERRRFLPAVLAVAFSALLIALQCGLLLVMFSVASIPVDRSQADIWVAAPQVLGVDLGCPIPTYFQRRLAAQEGVEITEVYVQGFNYWTKPSGGSPAGLSRRGARRKPSWSKSLEWESLADRDSFLPARTFPPTRLSLSLDGTRTREGYITVEGEQTMQFGQRMFVTI